MTTENKSIGTDKNSEHAKALADAEHEKSLARAHFIYGIHYVNSDEYTVRLERYHKANERIKELTDNV